LRPAVVPSHLARSNAGLALLLDRLATTTPPNSLNRIARLPNFSTNANYELRRQSYGLRLSPPDQVSGVVQCFERRGFGSGRLQLINHRQPLVDCILRQDFRRGGGVEMLFVQHNIRRDRSLYWRWAAKCGVLVL